MLEKEETERLFQNCFDKLLQLAIRYLKDEEEAKDIVSGIYVRIADGSIKLPQENPEGYLMVCVRNQCMDCIRKLSLKERLQRHLTMNTERIYSLETEEDKLQELMTYAEQTLASQTWNVFLLRFQKGLKYREIATQLSISEITVYKHLAQALRQLRNHFKNETR